MFEYLIESADLLVSATKQNMPILEDMTLVLFGVFVVNTLVGGRLCVLGIIPRKLYGLLGIAFAPFLHANFNHLFFNLIPLLVLSDFILIQGLEYFIYVTIFITLFSGFFIWCFGKSGIHLGASAVITGYWALLVMDIFYQGTLLAIVLGLISVYYFAGIFFGIFPTQKGVSWEGHFFGLVAGVMVNYLPYFLALLNRSIV